MKERALLNNSLKRAGKHAALKTNSSLKEIGELLRKAQSVILFPHESPDGDALGSCAALCRTLREEGKEAWVLLDEEVTGYLGFMDTEYCTTDAGCIDSPDICACIDCSEEKRFSRRAGKFAEGKLKLCIDHHATASGFADIYYIDSREAAAAQIIYKLLCEMDAEISRTTAESLYVGISTDTGSFRHSNTRAETHIIASRLFGCGIDHQKLIVNLYNSVSFKQVKMESEILNRMELIAGGKSAVSYVTSDMLAEHNAALDDCEGVIDRLRNIEGVEIAAFLKEKDGAVKVSLRAKTYGCVDEIAMKYGGGGHVKAAGCTLEMTMEEALRVIKDELEMYWNKF